MSPRPSSRIAEALLAKSGALVDRYGRLVVERDGEVVRAEDDLRARVVVLLGHDWSRAREHEVLNYAGELAPDSSGSAW